MSIRVGTAGRPCSGEAVSGDGWSVQWIDGACRVALIDGAGHGSPAAAATTAVLDVLDSDPSLDPASLLTRCHVALGHARGAVMTVATFGPAGALRVAGVGNIESHLWVDGRDQHLVTQRGMLGVNLPRIRTVELALAGEWRFVLHTDGVNARFRLGDLMLDDEAERGPDALAASILERHARTHDDAAVVAVLGGP